MSKYFQRSPKYQQKQAIRQNSILQLKNMRNSKIKNHIRQSRTKHPEYNLNKNIYQDKVQKTIKNQKRYVPNSIQQVIETINLYYNSANNLKQNLSIGVYSPQKIQKLESLNYYRPNNIIQSRNRKPILQQEQSNQSINVITKIQFFIKICSIQLEKIRKVIQKSSSSQIQTLGNSYNKILSYIKERYSQLIKQTFRTLNMQNNNTDLEHLNQEDKQLLKENRKRKLLTIGKIQKQMNMVWENNNQSNQNNQNITFKQNKFMKDYSTQLFSQKRNQNYSSLIVELEDQKSKNIRKVEFLKQNIEQLNLKKLAKQQLQKQFLAIRLQAYNMYQSYQKHSHSQFSQRLQFLKQEQQILQKQMQQYQKSNQEIKEQYKRLKRELSQIKTINQLIRKRYVLRQSIRMDSQEGIYD